MNLVLRREDLEDPPDLGPDFSGEQEKAQTMAKMAACGRQDRTIKINNSRTNKTWRRPTGPKSALHLNEDGVFNSHLQLLTK